ncbi:hypothetical protein BDK51DRAFT_50679 [Blyttiomyces helicus]|uniref:Uncharacterized protein n=1 Tax=Blyttiomyces helicus TaxID=388810 RepID=A0A4V1IS46_9FUNG|nr:hypothetical protein BDK51DRAFT_50679 [Blyttiomyces helicus]|eukprot:RKO92287.1 hypothetical protein BDK51DRAFT_50679 [Blyttiomyces helicus]
MSQEPGVPKEFKSSQVHDPKIGLFQDCGLSPPPVDQIQTGADEDTKPPGYWLPTVTSSVSASYSHQSAVLPHLGRVHHTASYGGWGAVLPQTCLAHGTPPAIMGGESDYNSLPHAHMPFLQIMKIWADGWHCCPLCCPLASGRLGNGPLEVVLRYPHVLPIELASPAGKEFVPVGAVLELRADVLDSDRALDVVLLTLVGNGWQEASNSGFTVDGAISGLE